MKSSTFLVPLAAGLIALGALAMTGDAGVAQAKGSKPPGETGLSARDRYACFDSGNIRSFDIKDSRHMIIVSDFNEAYELELGGACFGLDSAFGIGVRPRMGMNQICGAADADIVYHDPTSLRDLDSCPIANVRHLTGEDAAPYVVARSKRD